MKQDREVMWAIAADVVTGGKLLGHSDIIKTTLILCKDSTSGTPICTEEAGNADARRVRSKDVV
jgi:hypothetical protein